MVDINLLGDDQTPEAGEEKVKEYKTTFEPEVNEPTPRHYMSSEHIEDSDYTKVISRGGSKKTFYILLVCGIVLISIVVYYLMTQPQKGLKSGNVPTVTMTEPEAEPSVDTSRALTPPETNFATTSLSSPALRDKMIKSYRGIRTVSEILNTIPTNINFTLISYSDGKFFLEFLAPGDPDINQLNTQLQQNLASAEVTVLSKENRTINNRQFRQALVNGVVDFTQRAGTPGLQEPTYYNSGELKNQLSTICRQTGLTIKQFDSGLEKADGQFMILPIMFKAIGQKGKVMAFLQQLQSQNINISFSKISLIAYDVQALDPNITVVLNIGLYRMI